MLRERRKEKRARLEKMQSGLNSKLYVTLKKIKTNRAMCRMQRERGKKKMLQRAEGAGRLLLTMGQNRPHGKDMAGLVLLKETKVFSYKHRFN